jgi:hypothetical protein
MMGLLSLLRNNPVAFILLFFTNWLMDWLHHGLGIILRKTLEDYRLILWTISTQSGR